MSNILNLIKLLQKKNLEKRFIKMLQCQLKDSQLRMS